MTTYPQEGERVCVPVLTGYRLYQERRFECRPTCSCGHCNGTTVNYWGHVARVVYWADNSVEAEVACDDGETRVLRLRPPSGDVS